MRLIAILSAFLLLLTACGGAGEEPADDLPSLPDAPSVSDEAEAQGVQDESAPDEPDAPSVSEGPDAQGVSDGEDAQGVSDNPDAQSASDEPDAQDAPDEEETDTQDAPYNPGEAEAQLSGAILPVAEAIGEGVSVAKLADDARSDSCTVYLPENSQYVPFLVLDADSDGNALLLRRDVLPDFLPFNNYSAAYEDSAIDRFLNGEYLQRLDAVQNLIQPSEIVVTDPDALGVSGDAVRSASRNVFLLSCTETGFTELVNAGKEGTALSYFDDPSHRIAYRENGPAASWWLRTPDTYYLSAAYGVGPDGSLGSGNAYNENGVRPAFRLSPDAQAFQTNDLIDGQTVYFIPA